MKSVKLKPRKPKKLFSRKRTGEMLDEPSWGDDTIDNPSDFRLGRALNYYNYVDLEDKPKHRRRWLVEYVTSRSLLSAEEVKTLDKVDDWRIGNAVPATCRMIDHRGLRLSREMVDAHHARIRNLLDEHERSLNREALLKVKAADPDEHPRVDPSRRQASDIIADLDSAHDCGEEVSLYQMMTDRQSSQSVARMLIDHYEPVLAELKEAAGKNPDPSLKEAYGRMAKSELNSLVKQISDVVEDAKRFLGNRKATVVRKPRKKKEIDAAKVASSCLFLDSHPELKLVSVKPTEIVGARTVWIYVPKSKSLKRLVAPEGEGLTLSGSTVKGFEPELSEQRSLRKPEQVLPKVLDGTPRSLERVFDGLTTKPQTPNGRVGPDALILRTTKS